MDDTITNAPTPEPERPEAPAESAAVPPVDTSSDLGAVPTSGGSDGGSDGDGDSDGEAGGREPSRRSAIMWTTFATLSSLALLGWVIAAARFQMARDNGSTGLAIYVGIIGGFGLFALATAVWGWVSIRDARLRLAVRLAQVSMFFLIILVGMVVL